MEQFRPPKRSGTVKGKLKNLPGKFLSKMPKKENKIGKKKANQSKNQEWKTQ